MTRDRFPILAARECVERGQEYPASVSWNFVAPFAKQAELNHNQTLTRLAERGGLSPGELWCIANGKRLKDWLGDKKAIEWLKNEHAGTEWRVRY